MGTVKGKRPHYLIPSKKDTSAAWTILGRSGAMWTQTRAVAARTCPTLLPGFPGNLGHMRLALPLHVAIMGDTTMGDTLMVAITMVGTTMVGLTMVGTAMVGM